MSKILSQKKFCNCKLSSNKEILKSNVSHSFCNKCGTLLFKNINGTINYLLHAKQKKVFLDFNPIIIIKRMKSKTELNYPNIYNIYNTSNDESESKKAMKSINIYLKQRKNLIILLQKLMKTFDYCDIIFYQTLFFLDIYLSQDITFEMSEKSILYYLVGYFLCSIKLKETDIYEPAFDSFFDLEKGIYLSPSKIALSEVICLKRIKYNIFSYSSYDWVMQLISIGIVFNSEVDSTNEIILVKGHRHSLINTVNKYTVKLLLSLTNKDLFFKYSPMHLAFSIIQISREKYIQKNMIKPKLFFKLIELYGVNFSDYQDCYAEIKQFINESNKTNIKEDKNDIETIKNKDEKNDIKRGSVDKNMKSFLSLNKNKNIHVPNKIRSSNAVIYVNTDENNLLNENKEEKEEPKKRKRENKSKIKERLSIDCSGSNTKNNSILPIIKINTEAGNKVVNQNDIKATKFILNYLNEDLKIDKNKSSKALEKLEINIQRGKGKKMLTSTKLPKINIEEFTAENFKLNKKKEGYSKEKDSKKQYFGIKINYNNENKIDSPKDKYI